MARFKRDRPEARTRLLTIRATAGEIEFLKAEAARRGLRSASELVRAAVDEYLEKRARGPEGGGGEGV